MLTKRCADRLDQALVRVAQQEFDRLSRGHSQPELRKRVSEGLGSLGGLAFGTPADYDDPWVALLYLTWYFPRQVRLAADISASMFDSRRDGSQPLWILDYGCGTLATLFGLSLARDRRADRPPIGVLAIDPSEQMRRLGLVVWRTSPELVDNRILCAPRKEDFMKRLWSQPTYSTETWFIAMHAIYEENQERLSSIVDEFQQKYSPTEMVLTCNSQHEKRARKALPGATSLSMRDRRVHVLPRITKWRKDLGDQLKATPRDYLERTVDTAVRSPVILRRRGAK